MLALLLTILFAHSPVSCAEEEKLRITFINPSEKGSTYWDAYTDYMRVAADALDVELTVVYAKDNRLQSAHLAESILKQEVVPHYLIYIYQRGATQRILQMAEAKKVHSLIVNTNIPESEVDSVGRPRKKFKYWAGHIHPHNVHAGKQLAEQLTLMAHSQKHISQGKPIHLLALSGSRDSSAGLDYNLGLKQAVENDKQLVLQQLVFADWSLTKASYQINGLLDRYPQTQVVWSIGEEIALGIVNELQKRQLQPGKDVLVGGTVSTPKGVDMVSAGYLVANMGGDTWEGALAMVTLYDMYHGYDINATDHTLRYTTQFVTQNNVKPYIALINEQKWKKVNYKKMTFTHMKKRIPFNVHTLLKAAETGAEE